jgi:hypothetical protein
MWIYKNTKYFYGQLLLNNEGIKLNENKYSEFSYIQSLKHNLMVYYYSQQSYTNTASSVLTTKKWLCD